MYDKGGLIIYVPGGVLFSRSPGDKNVLPPLNPDRKKFDPPKSLLKKSLTTPKSRKKEFDPPK